MVSTSLWSDGGRRGREGAGGCSMRGIGRIGEIETGMGGDVRCASSVVL